MNADGPRIALFGAAPDTSNLGVSALCVSLLGALYRRIPRLSPVVFDNGLGLRRDNLDVGFGSIEVSRFGSRVGRRYHRPENLRSMRLLSGIPFARHFHAGLAQVDSCSVVLDVSGGDSFSDIYGNKRFQSTLFPKQIAQHLRKPLVLLPQTYGPYRSRHNSKAAASAILGADLAWARDPLSYDVLKNLLGNDFDPARHRLGVDMAFGLPTTKPGNSTLDSLGSILDSGDTLVGINLSGLIWKMDSDGLSKLGFRTQYRTLVLSFIAWLLRNTGARVLLIPHVLAKTGDKESDRDAAIELAAELAEQVPDSSRLHVVGAEMNEREVKWIISQCDWFCGTRMHSTIAALSSGVATCSIVYSNKARGVFQTCDQGSQIVDPRAQELSEAQDALIQSFEQRSQISESLKNVLPSVMRLLESQMDSIADFVISKNFKQ